VGSHNAPLAAINPPDVKYLRVSSFNVYRDGRWVREGGDFGKGVVTGKRYSVSITPFAVLLYPAFPVPEPYPGTVPKVLGGSRSGDTFAYGGFRATVVAEYADPYPRESFPQLLTPLKEVAASKPKQWSTKRVQELAMKLYNDFKHRTLLDLLNYMTNWLRSNYKYALVYSGSKGKDPVDWFLFVSKTGICTHFASAAAVLLNDMGIRARVVYGFAVSYVKGSVRVFVIPTHLWVEVWVPGKGWIPWDPSPPQALRVDAPQVMGGERRVTPPSLAKAEGGAGGRKGRGGGGLGTAISVNFQELLPYVAVTITTLTLFSDVIKKWLTSWPLAFRECAEKRIKKRGLTLRELAELTGIKELEEVQVKYLKSGKWVRKGLLKAIAWCVKRR
jgi:transglutaminase-like putative cysteine protease